MNPVGWMRDARLGAPIAELGRFYAAARTHDQVRRLQLERLNEVWREVGSNVPFFRALGGSLPESFASWEEFFRVVPASDRNTLKERGAAMLDPRRAPDFWQATGGSTATPLRVPGWRSERAVASANAWLARSWFGVRPSDPLFLIWGHAHLLGTRASAAARRIKDRLLGYRRWSAYDLGDEALRRAAEALLEIRPAWVLGYSVALDRFARVNRARAGEFARLDLKVAIATAESFPSADSAARVADVLGCPVRMEYGAVETGVLAHQRTAEGYAVFWRDWAVESIASADVPGVSEIAVTALHPRCLPLIRYRLGDVIAVPGGTDPPHDRLVEVSGRCNDWIRVGNAIVHSEAFTHAVKECDALGGYQVVQAGNGELRLEYVAPAPLAAPDEGEIRRRLGRVHPELASISIVRRDRLEQTVAGKSKPIRREPA